MVVGLAGGHRFIGLLKLSPRADHSVRVPLFRCHHAQRVPLTPQGLPHLRWRWILPKRTNIQFLADFSKGVNDLDGSGRQTRHPTR